MIEVANLRKAFGERLLIDDLSFKLPAGAIVGIIGPNGAGKTTLFRMLTGSEKQDAGTIRAGPSVNIAYVDQSRDKLDDTKTVWQEISGGQDIIKVGNYETPSRGYVGRFNFRGNQQQQHIGATAGALIMKCVGGRSQSHCTIIARVSLTMRSALPPFQDNHRNFACRLGLMLGKKWANLKCFCPKALAFFLFGNYGDSIKKFLCRLQQ